MANHIERTLQDLYDLGRKSEAFDLAIKFGVDNWKPSGVIEYVNGMTAPDKHGAILLEKLQKEFGKYPKHFHDLKKYRFICKETLENFDLDDERTWAIKLNLEMADIRKKKLGEKCVQAVMCRENNLRTYPTCKYYRTVEKIPQVFVVPQDVSVEEFAEYFIEKIKKTIHDE